MGLLGYVLSLESNLDYERLVAERITSKLGAGCLRSTARDMLRYLAANMGLVPTELHQSMTNAHKVLVPADGNDSIGLALASIRRPVSVDLSTLQSYFGRYQASDGNYFDIGLTRGGATHGFRLVDCRNRNRNCGVWVNGSWSPL
jgi:hypothetical protein